MSDAIGLDVDCLDDRPMRATLALADGLAKTLRIAKALLQSGRTIDLMGLEMMIGLLCARALDLPPEHGRAVRPELMTLRNETDALIALLAEREREQARPAADDAGSDDTGSDDTGRNSAGAEH
jgi:hypothetical protein